MNFVDKKWNSASCDTSFCRNVIEICERCCLHFPEKVEFQQFLEELFQITFLKSEDVLLEDERKVLKTLYKNNEKPFLVTHQLWLKFGHRFFYLENRTIKFAVLLELNKVQSLLKEIKKLEIADARATVLLKYFF